MKRIFGLGGIGLALWFGASPAEAEPDNRAQDRFFFGFAGGANLDEDHAFQGTLETTFWPTDWLGMGSVASLSTATSYDLGGELVLAVPLRWVQPYGGGWVGLRTTASEIRTGYYTVAGLNIYASRNTRLFVEARGDEMVVAGLRFSPDWFHRARGVTKLDAVWWSALASAAAWGGATYAR